MAKWVFLNRAQKVKIRDADFRSLGHSIQMLCPKIDFLIFWASEENEQKIIAFLVRFSKWFLRVKLRKNCECCPLSLFIEGSLLMLRLFFSIVRNANSVSMISSLQVCPLSLSLSFLLITVMVMVMVMVITCLKGHQSLNDSHSVSQWGSDKVTYRAVWAQLKLS